MAPSKRILRSTDTEASTLIADGWTVIARSWGAGLHARDIDADLLDRSIAGAGGVAGADDIGRGVGDVGGGVSDDIGRGVGDVGGGVSDGFGVGIGGVRGVRIAELTADDVGAILALDAATAHDYPGDIANAHHPLTVETATPGTGRRAWGAFAGPRLVAMTFVDVTGSHAETDVTVVAADWRRRGLGTAVKAASITALAAAGIEIFRTGGSADNAGSIAANLRLGYVIDEEWWTLAAPSQQR